MHTASTRKLTLAFLLLNLTGFLAWALMGARIRTIINDNVTYLYESGRIITLKDVLGFGNLVTLYLQVLWDPYVLYIGALMLLIILGLYINIKKLEKPMTDLMVRISRVLSYTDQKYWSKAQLIQILQVEDKSLFHLALLALKIEGKISTLYWHYIASR